MADDPDEGGEGGEDAAFTTRFNKLFHKAFDAKMGKVEKTLLMKFDATLSSKFDELRNALAPIDDDDDDDGDDEGAGGNETVDTPAPQRPAASSSKMSPEDRARIKRAEATAKEAAAIAEKYKQQAEEEAAKRRQTEERQTIVSLMTPHVKPKMLDIAVNHALANNLIRDDENGQLLWKGEDGEALPLKDGVAAWAKSDVGKEFAPPVEARGRGGRGPGENGIAPGKMTFEGVGDIVAKSIPGQGR